MKFMSSVLVCVILLGSLAAKCAGNVEATVGSVFVLPLPEGTTGKPKIYALQGEPQGGPNRIQAKVQSYGGGSVTCLWTKRLFPGSYPLFLKPSGGTGEPIAMGNLIIKGPEIREVAFTGVNPGDQVHLGGKFFSTKKVKVYLEDPSTFRRTPCRVTSSYMEPTTGESQATFIVPRGGFAGKKVVLRNLIGEATWSSKSAGVRGTVTDPSGGPIAGVMISAGSQKVTSDQDGSYFLPASPGQGIVVQLTKNGFVPSSRMVNVPEGVIVHLPVSMMPLAAPSILDAGEGGTILGTRGERFEAPPGSFMDQRGNPITGKVQVSLTYYDPASPMDTQAYPGELRGLTVEGRITPLRTYGVVDISVQKDGQPLKLREGMSLRVSVPAPPTVFKPERMEIWFYDAQRALWIEQPVPSQYNPESNSYEALVEGDLILDLPVNWDKPINPTCIYGIVIDSLGRPIQGALVSARSADPRDTAGIYSFMHTGPYGNYCMTVEMDSDVLLRVTTPDGTVTERTIRSGKKLSLDYPADCSNPSCKLMRTIVVGTSDPGEEAQCNFTLEDNPFMSTCLAPLGELFTCFKPQGTCVYRISLGLPWEWPSITVNFANGARMEQRVSVIFEGIYNEMMFYGPGRVYCGKLSVSEDGYFKLELPHRKELSFRLSSTEDGRIMGECRGYRFYLDEDQIEALYNCQGSLGEGEGVPCSPAPGSFAGPCRGGWDCDEDLSCCRPFITGKSQCLVPAMCELACQDNWDCQYGICCFNGLFNQCMPPGFCK